MPGQARTAPRKKTASTSATRSARARTLPSKAPPNAAGKPSTAKEPAHLEHGTLRLPSVLISNYSLELREGEGFLGDTVSRVAFRDTLNAWRKVFTKIDGKDPLGSKPTEELTKSRIDELHQRGKGLAAATIQAAIDDYAAQFAAVVQRFMQEPSWNGVQRIVVGGGFQQSRVGTLAIRQAAQLLAEQQFKVQVQNLRHHADEGGLLGWLHLAPADMVERYDALLTVDIGGTNVRCGIVRIRRDKAEDLSKAKVLGREKWSHAEDEDTTSRMALVEGIADMLKKLIKRAKKKGITLAPFVGVACPGLICEDGSIAAGAQNLPGNWESVRFNLANHLAELLPKIDGQVPQVHLHNDAVVQGLSELPFMQDVRRWAVLTVGTGLGNVSYTNRVQRTG